MNRDVISLRAVYWLIHSCIGAINFACLQRFSRFGAAVCIVVNFISPASADSIQSLRFSHLTQEHGMPSSSVMSILQDTQGFMWLGTVNGLARYDGRQFKTFEFDGNNPASLSNPLVTALFEDDEGVLWIGTRSGFDRLDLRSETIQRQTLPAELSLQNRRVSGIAAGPKGKLWVAMFGGLHLFDTQTRQFSAWNSANSSLQGRVFVIISDAKGGVWVGQGNQIAHIDQDGKLRRVFSSLTKGASSQNPVDFQVRSLAFDAEQRLWVGMEKGLQIWKIENEGQNPDPLRHQFDLPAGLVRVILRDSDGAMWVGQGEQHGISKWNNVSKKLERYTHSRAIASSLNPGAVQSLTQDRNGSLWVGTSDSGAAQTDLRSKRFGLYLNESVGNKNLASPVVMAINFYSERMAWVGTYSNGLVSLNLESGDIDVIPESQMPLTKIKAQFWAPDGKLWIGGDGGLFLFDPKRRISQKIDLRNQLAAGASISSITLDRVGNLWAGSALGLYRIGDALGRDVLAKYVAQAYRTDSQAAGALGHDVVDSLLVDVDGRLWVGTKGGLYLWQSTTATFQSAITPSSILPNSEKLAILAIRQDQKKRIWLATEVGLFDLSEKDGHWQLHSWWDVGTASPDSKVSMT